MRFDRQSKEMMVVKLIRWASIAFSTALMLGATIASTAAEAAHPLFLTESKKTLLFIGEGAKPVLRALNAGLPAVLECEKVLVHGLILHASTLAHLLPLVFEGKCVRKINGGANEGCGEPIVTKTILAELGLLNSTTKTVVILLAPDDGTTVFFKDICGSQESTLEGTIVGEIPALNALGENQYNVERTELEVIFATNPAGSDQQKITTIFLLGTEMTGQELKCAGFFGGKCAWEMTWNLKADGKVKLDV